MNLRKYRIKMSIFLQLSLLFTLSISPVSLFAFSDMNDSTAQEDVVKSLQKRLDSLELRFEKSEIEKNEAKKSVFDWERGFHINISFDMVNFTHNITPTTTSSFGYMISKTKNNNSRIILCPTFRFGFIPLDKPNFRFHDSLSEKPIKRSSDLYISTGLERMKRLVDRISYTDGWFINVVPNYAEHESPLYAFGGEYSNSVNFSYRENSSIGAGFFYRLTYMLDGSSSWNTALKKGTGFSMQSDVGFLISYTASFARHEAKSRSK